jgi:hypothetical protein
MSHGLSLSTSPRAVSSSTTLPTWLRRAIGCLSSSRGLSSTTSPMPCARVPWHVAWLVVDHFASGSSSFTTSACRAARRRPLRLGRLVVDYFAYAVRPGASARRRPLHLGWLVDYFSSRRLVVDYFAYAARPGASATPALLQVCRAPPRHRLSAASRRPLILTSFPNQSRTTRMPQQLVRINSDWSNFSNNCHGSICDHHSFINSLPSSNS